MSLLTDENGKLNVPVYREHIRGVKAKTLKAVAEWGRADCTEHGKPWRRADCSLCVWEMIELATEGKMLGEE